MCFDHTFLLGYLWFSYWLLGDMGKLLDHFEIISVSVKMRMIILCSQGGTRIKLMFTYDTVNTGIQHNRRSKQCQFLLPTNRVGPTPTGASAWWTGSVTITPFA